MELKNWLFSADGRNWEKVTVPHTWNVDGRYQELLGKCYYKTELSVDKISDFNILRFEAAYHDAQVYVNGKKVSEHSNSGYTPFDIDITGALVRGENEIAVSVDNSFSDECLPWRDQFDWSSDGGLIREVHFEQHMATDIQDIFVYVTDLLPTEGNRANAFLNIEAKLFSPIKDFAVTAELNGSFFKAATNSQGKIKMSLPLEGYDVWTPEEPCLHRVTVNEKTVRFGVKCVETVGNKLHLNKKEYIFKGVEWMPGSHPDYGMAEPREFAIKNLEMLKELGCNFTRFHWQQPDFVYDWCDENGIMVQEEIPYWGPPKLAEQHQLDIAKMQANEMFHAHKNHTSIVFWGVGNELDGGKTETVRYVREIADHFKRLDRTRLVNYVSNTLQNENELDAAMIGDICMWNDYTGLWFSRSSDVDGVLQSVLKKCNGKPLVITEAGLCEPTFKGGDRRRCEIYEEREGIYRNSELAGWIYFSLNDYRTQMGEEGEGKLRRRVHGSTDLCGNKKPSFEVLKKLLRG